MSSNEDYPIIKGETQPVKTFITTNELEQLQNEFPIPEKSINNVRFLTFNINGFNTLFNYYPWNKLKNLTGSFEYVKADIVTLQELKVSKESINNSLGKLDGYNSFITIPTSKKGYSGVGIYIRKPSSKDSDYIKELLTIKKAEEGISGYLQCRDYKLGEKTYKDIFDLAKRYENTSTDSTYGYGKIMENHLIGGYVNVLNRNRCEQIDSEGRCVIVELGFNVVIISVYCPANSQGSKDGELFRLDFLKLLIARAKALETIGKKVIIMGDINISRDLIDNAEAIQQLFEKGVINKPTTQQGEDFENINKNQIEMFAKNTIPRVYLNSAIHGSSLTDKEVYIDKNHNILENDNDGRPVMIKDPGNLFVDSDDDNDGFEDSFDDDGNIPINETIKNDKFLYDLIRENQGRKLKLYTCWNTLKNYRSINFGSRIDLILSTEDLKKLLMKADILPHLNGSDHCPVYADFNIDDKIGNLSGIANENLSLPKFEAKFVYGLNELTIVNMFKNFNKYSMLSKRKIESSSSYDEVEFVKQEPKKKPKTEGITIDLGTKNGGKKMVYVSRKSEKSKQQNIQSFFKAKTKPSNTDVLIRKAKEGLVDSKLNKPNGLAMLGKAYSNAPKCHHGNRCILKTSMTEKTKGKKFWCCNKPSIRNNNDVLKTDSGSLDKDISCGFFQWNS